MDLINKKILVVDDSLTIRMQIKGLLESEGYKVLLAEDGEKCLKTIKSEIPDIILLDIIMPGISGLDVCRTIKGDDKYKDIPILMLTHVSDSENKVAGLRSGANDYVTKPFVIEELNARIDSILKTKMLEQKLRFSRDKAHLLANSKSSFLANMSHEIRTPMNGIIAFTDLLLETNLETEQRKFIEALKRSGESLLVIINDILDFSKIESGNVVFEEIGFKIDQLLDDVTKLIAIKVGDKPIKVIKNIKKDVPTIFVSDPHRIKQVLLNILGNSAKFTQKGEISSYLWIEQKKANRAFLHFEIKDTGIGIPEDKLEAIFELFTQADSSTTRKFGGTGLGLSISKKIAMAMGGDCWAKSELDKGSTFHFTGWCKIGSVDDIRQKKDENIELEKVIAKNNLQIFLVEDNPVNQMVAKKMIENMGNNVQVAGNGKIAIEMFSNSNSAFDIIFMDMQMPEVDGITATKEIRKIEKKIGSEKRIPIIAMTANVLPEHEKMCIKAGMNDFITKPINKTKIFNGIQKWVK